MDDAQSEAMEAERDAVTAALRSAVPPPSGSTRRDELVRVAAQLFRSKGFNATTTREIAAAMDLQSGALFYYFESKDALLQAVMEDGMTMVLRSQTQLMQALPSDTTASQRLRALIRHHLEVVAGAGHDFIPVMLYEWRALAPAQKKCIAATKDRYEAQWIPVLEELHEQGLLRAEPKAARLLLFGALNWFIHWFEPRQGMDLDEFSDQAMLLVMCAP